MVYNFRTSDLSEKRNVNFSLTISRLPIRSIETGTALVVHLCMLFGTWKLTNLVNFFLHNEPLSWKIHPSRTFFLPSIFFFFFFYMLKNWLICKALRGCSSHSSGGCNISNNDPSQLPENKLVASINSQREHLVPKTQPINHKAHPLGIFLKNY